MRMKLVIFSIAFLFVSACKNAQESADVSSQQDLDLAAQEQDRAKSLKALRAELEKPIGAFCGVIPLGTSYEEVQREYLAKLNRESAAAKEAREFKFDLAKLLHETKTVDLAAWATFAKATQIGEKATAAAVEKTALALQAYLRNPQISKTKAAAQFTLKWGTRVADWARFGHAIPQIAGVSQAVESIAERATGLASKVVGGNNATGSALQGAAAFAVQLRFVVHVTNVAMWAYSDVLAACNIANLAFAIMDTKAAQADLRAAEAKMRDIDPKYCCAIRKRKGQWPDSKIAACTEQRKNYPQSCNEFSLD